MQIAGSPPAEAKPAQAPAANPKSGDDHWSLADLAPGNADTPAKTRLPDMLIAAPDRIASARHLVASRQIPIEFDARSVRYCPRVPSLEACGRRPRVSAVPSVRGRHPQPFTLAEVEFLIESLSYSGTPALRRSA